MENLSKADKFLFNLIFVLGALIVIGNLLDMVTTYFALQHNYTFEANPAMSYVIKNFGWIPFILIKGFFCLLFFPYKYAPLVWLARFSLNIPNNYIKQFNIGVVLTSHIVSILWFWSLAIANFHYI